MATDNAEFVLKQQQARLLEEQVELLKEVLEETKRANRKSEVIVRLTQ